VARNVAVLTDAPRVERPDIRPLDPVGAARLLAAVRGDRLEAVFDSLKVVLTTFW